MLLDDKLKGYQEEISRLYTQYLNEKPVANNTFFGIVENEELQAVASIQCYYGAWYLRACVVKPEHRGKGLQRRLIRERIEYLSDITDCVKVSVYPWNSHSINNVLAEGFVFEKKRKLPSGKIVSVYKKKI